MIKFRQKDFSIQEGGYKGSRRELNKASYSKRMGILGGIGAGVGMMAVAEGTKGSALNRGLAGAGVGLAAGAAIGAFTAWMHNKCDESAFNTGLSNGANSYTLIQYLEELYANTNPDNEELNISRTNVDLTTGSMVTVAKKTTRSNTSGVVAKGILYSVDDDPNKHVISMYYSANTLVLYVNKPRNNELSFLNKILDDYCFKYKNADYTATQIRNNVYEIEVAVVDGTEGDICEKLIDSGFCLNIVTGNRF